MRALVVAATLLLVSTASAWAGNMQPLCDSAIDLPPICPLTNHQEQGATHERDYNDRTGSSQACFSDDSGPMSFATRSSFGTFTLTPCRFCRRTSNNIIQKGLAFGRDWSGSVVVSGR